MSASIEQRKLAAIMFTDMVGYTVLSQRDDKLALELLEEHRQLLREIFPRFNGTEIKTIGDAFLVEFQSALEAAQCAIEIQRTLAKRNHDVTLERRIELKIGIHIGDVVHRGGDVYGDGVNIASRIEPLAGAGGVCVSMDVERQIRNALEARFEKLAPTELKNISVAMDLFRIVLPWEQKSEVRGQKSERSVVPKNRRSVFIGALGLLFVIGIGCWWWTTQPRRSPISSAPPSIAPAANEKSIAVLPFVDMSQAKDQEYFCDGISEEILDTLAKVDGLRVVARTSSFSFKGKNADVGEVAKKLNVENVLEGSLRRAGNRIRITAQLINARDGFHLWSETYERDLEDVFAVQDEITRSIVDALKIKLAVAPPARAQQNTDAYDLYLQGLYLSNKSGEEDLHKALSFFQKALDRDPKFSRAWTGLARVWARLADAYVKPLDAYPIAKAAAERALALDERDPVAHCILGFSKMVLYWDQEAMFKESKRAVEIDPNSALAHDYFGNTLRGRGDLSRAIEEYRIAAGLDPLSPAVSDKLAEGYLIAGKLNDAITQGKRTLELDPRYAYLDSTLANAYREKGLFDQAIMLYQQGEQFANGPSRGLAITYARAGKRAEAEEVLARFLAQREKKYISAAAIGLIYGGLGNKDEAFRWLDRAYDDHDAVLITIAYYPGSQPLRDDPRFIDLVRRVGLDPARAIPPNNVLR